MDTIAKELFDIISSTHKSGHIVDIGACNFLTDNMRYFHESGHYKILLIEPDPRQAQLISSQIKGTIGVELEAVAVWENDTEIEFTVSPIVGHSRIENENFKKAKPKSPKGEVIKVHANTYRSIINRHPEFRNAVFVKIDVEGNDEIVLNQVLPYEPYYIMIEHQYDKSRIGYQRSKMRFLGYKKVKDFNDSTLYEHDFTFTSKR